MKSKNKYCFQDEDYLYYSNIVLKDHTGGVPIVLYYSKCSKCFPSASKHNVILRFMLSNDLRKVGTSIKLQLSVITCINSGIVPGLFLNTLFFRYGKTK
jgi:hypothetical protein